MSKPLRNPKYEIFARAIVLDGKEPAEAYVLAGFERNRANHNRLIRDPRVKGRIVELNKERELAALAALTPVADVLGELEQHGIERLSDFFQSDADGGLAVRDLRAVQAGVALAFLTSLHEGFGVSWEQPAILAAKSS